MPKYAILDKDTIKTEIMPYLSIAKRGYTSKFDLIEVVNAILYKREFGIRNTIKKLNRQLFQAADSTFLWCSLSRTRVIKQALK